MRNFVLFEFYNRRAPHSSLPCGAESVFKNEERVNIFVIHPETNHPNVVSLHENFIMLAAWSDKFDR